MKKQTHILSILIISFLITHIFAQAPTTTGTISKVTVYRGQALVTRVIDIDLPSGTSELIVKDLPAKIVPESLYAQTSDNIKVLSVRYREKAVRVDTREEVKKLDEQIEKVKNQLQHAEWDLEHNRNQWKTFENLRQFTITAANIDLNRGLLDFEPLRKLTEHIEEKGSQYHKKEVELNDKIAALKKELELLARQRQQLAAGYSRTEREAVLFISNQGQKKARIEISYLVNGANWLPQYNLRANPDESSVLIEYNAVINQTSGEDWNSIALNLSTAQPTMVAAAPILEPMPITLARAPVSVQELEAKQKLGVHSFLDRSEDFERLLRSRYTQAKKGKAAQEELSRIAVINQLLEFTADEIKLEEMKQQAMTIARTEGISVTYKLPGKPTLPSRTDQQLATIATIDAQADFTLIATPLLTDYVYLQAELLNDSNTILLSGQSSMFCNGEFVGKGQLPIVTIGEKFIAGFGVDSQIQVVRELEDKKTRIQGGNRIDTYRYRIAVSNYKDTPVELRLLDRLPYTDDASIKIELGETEPPLSEDSEYLRTAKKKGLLRWDLRLAGNTVDEKATIVTYSFTMEYDKNMQIQPRSSGI